MSPPTRPARRDSKRVMSSIDGAGNEAGWKKTTRTKSKAKEVLQGDPNVAPLHNGAGPRRRCAVATVAATRAAPDRSHDPGAAAAAEPERKTQMPDQVPFENQGRFETQGRIETLGWIEIPGRVYRTTRNNTTAEKKVGWTDRFSVPRVSETGFPALTSSQPLNPRASPQRDSNEVTELKKIIERQNAQIQAQNVQIRALMSKVDALAVAQQTRDSKARTILWRTPEECARCHGGTSLAPLRAGSGSGRAHVPGAEQPRSNGRRGKHRQPRDGDSGGTDSKGRRAYSDPNDHNPN